MRDPMKPHNLTLTMIGAGLLWFGWYGFNVGSMVFNDGTVKSWGGFLAQFEGEMSTTFLNTTVATMCAMLGWLAVERMLHGKATSLGAASGIVAGLVAITPSCGAVNITGAIVVGAVAGMVCAWAVGLKYKFGLDDSLDVVGVHLVGGIIGALLIGFVGTTSSPQGVDGFFPKGANGIFYGGDLTLLGHQAAGVLFTLVWTGVLTTVIGLAIKHTIGWRIDHDAELEGIDAAQHGEVAYDFGGHSSGSLAGATAGALHAAAAARTSSKEEAMA
jgi:Amt family ammonium transporter